MYVLYTHDKKKYLLNQREHDVVVGAIVNDDKVVIVQGDVIPLHITPGIMRFERWYAQENDRLAMTDKRLCKKCLGIMSVFDSCSCWEDRGKGEERDALNGVVNDAVKEIAYRKRFPRLTEADKADIERQKALQAPEYVEEGGGLGYKDPESGEIMYS